MTKIPSPCIDVCKFTDLRRCVGCGMTKRAKKKFKGLSKRKHKRAFVRTLAAEIAGTERGRRWERAYRRKCRKTNKVCVLDCSEG